MKINFKKKLSLVGLISILLMNFNLNAKELIQVGSKQFTESYIIAEIISQIIEDTGEAGVKRRFGLGATGISFAAVDGGEIDLYPEYTGTISEAILNNKELSLDNEKLANVLMKDFSIHMSKTLGFNNTYSLAINQKAYKRLSIESISDLSNHQDIRGVFTHEFMQRGDGLSALENFYRLRLTNTSALEHSLAYEAIRKSQVDLMEVYSTDAKIEKYNLKLLKDDKNFFPKYFCVLLSKKNFRNRYPQSWQALQSKLIGQIDEQKMRQLNAMVELDGHSFSQAAAFFLGKQKWQNKGVSYDKVFKLTLEHLKLVFVSLFFSIILGIPIGIMAAKTKLLGRLSLIGSGILQTIPSLALLCFLIPFFGIGETPAYVALFMYGLLPIVRNTYTGITQIDCEIMESAQLLGLTKFEQLRLVQLPLASINIMAGIKTSAIINIGTATLAAFIGAGGLGSLIVTGLALNNNSIILTGAIPSALLAASAHVFFELVDIIVIPKGLKNT